MKVTITESARGELANLMKDSGYSKPCLRLTLAGAG